MRLAIVAVVVALCAAIGAYLYLSYIQPSVGVAAQTQLPLSSTTTSAATQQATNPTSTPSVVPATISPSSATSTVSLDTTKHPGMKLYHNDEYGFEFWYPEEWEWQAGTFGSPSSKFNYLIMKIDGANTDQNEGLNIVTDSFYKNYLVNMERLQAQRESVVVDGVRGSEYAYVFEDTPTIDVSFPIGQYWLILGLEKEHEKELRTMISSFKFIR
jgi:hypothetical protein